MVKIGAENRLIAVASHMELCETLSQRTNFEFEVSSFLESQLSSLLILMGLEIFEADQSGEKKIRRDIMVIPANENLGQKLISGLKKIPELNLIEKQTMINNASLYEQDVAYSRKKVIPLLHNIAI